MAKKLSDPDPILCRDQREMLLQTYALLGPVAFVALMIWIRRKSGELVPFKFNRIQKDALGELAAWNIWLKARQQGFTTWLLIFRAFLPILLHGGRNSLLVLHKSKLASLNLRTAKRALRWIGAQDPNDRSPGANELCDALRANLFHTSYSNRSELIFSQLDSMLMIGSSEVEEEGQSLPLHHLVASEYARWVRNPEDTLSNIMGAVTKEGTVDVECTANGAAGSFWNLFREAKDTPEKSAFKLHFYEWYWSDEYFLELAGKEEEKELLESLTEEEILLIAQMHQDLKQVAYTGKKRNRVVM